MLLKSYVLYFLCAFLLLLYNESTFHVLFSVFQRQLYFYCFLFTWTVTQQDLAWRTQAIYSRVGQVSSDAPNPNQQARNYLNISFRCLLHADLIAPPHLPRLIPPPNRPTHTRSSGEQACARCLTDTLREHPSPHRNSETGALGDAQK